MSGTTMNTGQKGDIAETRAIAELVELGYRVSVPTSGHCPYDLVLDTDDELLKIQVKHATLRDDERMRRCSLKRSNPNATETNDSYYGANEVDAYLVFCPEKETLYWIDFDDAPAANVVLRFESSVDHPDIRWADEYEL
ncbi:group I intron-associated PD-(D/E)XK endonuclease [Halococcus salsus]|uniref:group I intron-associated PD-(D/E)XK endonuclease n=1 Tax=Halococcus salsus TaxID=2162894 RepID=UPI001F04773F|nr:group I intron-associated PD-(D/E)XK endonuclease [Halococcus salsus]